MKRLVPYAAVLLTFASAGLASAHDVPTPPEWRQFRESYPYHIQGVALSKPRPDGSRVVIVAEPPPHLDANRLSTLLSSATSVQFLRHPVGYDGWLRDAVAVVPPGSADTIPDLIDTLHREMFGTTYKAFTLPIDAGNPSTAVDAASLDLKVSGADLERWLRPGSLTLSNAPTRFRRIGASESVSARAILEGSLVGTFVSTEPALVLCALPTTTALAAFSVELRKFALDSDIILGAIKKGTEVIIIGRERVAPVNVLPPLRVETMLQLASVKSDELAQSYERNNIIAGRYDDKHDWAPIYLSSALIDTEYGSLLNITDQLLKSWSMHGFVHYLNFDYPTPPGYPFDAPLNEYAKTSNVTFNWNTKGAGYVVDAHGVQILALNRTGALPVDYLGSADARLLTAEDRAYEYFSRTGDPNLVRVVQYAGLYQIFRRFAVTTPAPRSIATANATPKAARVAAAAIVRDLRSLDKTKVMSAFERASSGTKADPAYARDLRELILCIVAVDTLYQKGGDALLARLPEALAAPREFSVATATDKQVLAIAYQMMNARIQDWVDYPLKSVMEQYSVESLRPAQTWIRTPSLVVSWGQKPDGKSLGGIGGHNLSAVTSAMRADAAVAAGEVRILEAQGRRILLFNPADESRIAGLVREFGRGTEKPVAALQTELRTTLRTLKPSERPLLEALGFKAPAGSTRGLAARHVPGTPAELGWRFSDLPTPAQVETLRAVADARSPVFILERNSDGTFALYGDSGRRVLTAGNAVSVSDGLTDLIREVDPALGPVRLHIRGMTPNQGKGFVEAAELRLPREQRRGITGTLEDGSMGTTDLKRILANDFEFSNARIDRISEPIYSAKGAVLDVEMNVPARVASRPSLIVRVKLFFEGVAALPAQISASVRNILTSWRVALKPQLTTAEFATAVKALETDLRRVHPSLNVDVVLSSEGKDIHIVRNDLNRTLVVLADVA